MPKWRLANSLSKIRSQIDEAFPKRSKVSDGTIGDMAHATRKSDHNPWVKDGDTGIVTAIDITHDPASGCDANALAESLVNSRDSRIKYIIWNRRIVSSTTSPWIWREYKGANPHNKHLHLSVLPEKSRYDDDRPWIISGAKVAARPPTLRKGSVNSWVLSLQAFLQKQGYNITIDGTFGDKTEEAVKQLQARHNLSPDGIVGPQTWRIIEGGD